VLCSGSASCTRGAPCPIHRQKRARSGGRTHRRCAGLALTHAAAAGGVAAAAGGRAAAAGDERKRQAGKAGGQRCCWQGERREPRPPLLRRRRRRRRRWPASPLLRVRQNRTRTRAAAAARDGAGRRCSSIRALRAGRRRAPRRARRPRLGFVVGAGPPAVDRPARGGLHFTPPSAGGLAGEMRIERRPRRGPRALCCGEESLAPKGKLSGSWASLPRAGRRRVPGGDRPRECDLLSARVERARGSGAARVRKGGAGGLCGGRAVGRQDGRLAA
jgi:hypothetical protein